MLDYSIQKQTKVFISHSNKDIEYVINIVKLLEDIGLREEDIFCSSIPGYNIPVNEDIYDYLKKQFEEYNLYVIFLLSENYYNSPACLNEMGMAWALLSDYMVILTPQFKFESIKGAINPRKVGIRIDTGSDEFKGRLNEFIDIFIELFDLPHMTFAKWERIRNAFIKKNNEIKISDNDFEFDTTAGSYDENLNKIHVNHYTRAVPKRRRF